MICLKDAIAQYYCIQQIPTSIDVCSVNSVVNLVSRISIANSGGGDLYIEGGGITPTVILTQVANDPLLMILIL